jgi:hypothetical protein
MTAIDILDTAQYVVDKNGRQTAVLLDLSSWQLLRQLLEELAEDEKLGELMTAVQNDEKLATVTTFESDLLTMANDPQIQWELQQIEEEFAFTEVDGSQASYDN